jgi:hypothetical protein
VQKAGQRKLIPFLHHQPFSRLDKQGPNLQAALADLFQRKAKTIANAIEVTGFRPPSRASTHPRDCRYGDTTLIVPG